MWLVWNLASPAHCPCAPAHPRRQGSPEGGLSPRDDNGCPRAGEPGPCRLGALCAPPCWTSPAPGGEWARAGHREVVCCGRGRPACWSWGLPGPAGTVCQPGVRQTRQKPGPLPCAASQPPPYNGEAAWAQRGAGRAGIGLAPPDCSAVAHPRAPRERGCKDSGAPRARAGWAVARGPAHLPGGVQKVEFLGLP